MSFKVLYLESGKYICGLVDGELFYDVVELLLVPNEAGSVNIAFSPIGLPINTKVVEFTNSQVNRLPVLVEVNENSVLVKKIKQAYLDEVEGFKSSIIDPAKKGLILP